MHILNIPLGQRSAPPVTKKKRKVHELFLSPNCFYPGIFQIAIENLKALGRLDFLFYFQFPVLEVELAFCGDSLLHSACAVKSWSQ